MAKRQDRGKVSTENNYVLTFVVRGVVDCNILVVCRVFFLANHRLFKKHILWPNKDKKLPVHSLGARFQIVADIYHSLAQCFWKFSE